MCSSDLTFGRKLTRFRVSPDGSLSGRETVAVFGRGTFPDGLTLDAAGGIWITSLVSNRVIRVRPDGSQQLILEDAEEGHVAWVEEAFLSGAMGRPHLDRCAGRALKNISSLAFAGKDRRTAVLGCLLGDALACFPSPVAGLPSARRRGGVQSRCTSRSPAMAVTRSGGPGAAMNVTDRRGEGGLTRPSGSSTTTTYV